MPTDTKYIYDLTHGHLLRSSSRHSDPVGGGVPAFLLLTSTDKREGKERSMDEHSQASVTKR